MSDAASQADLDAVAATFSLVADDEAVDEILFAFERRLEHGPIDERSPLHGYVARAAQLLGRHRADAKLDELESLVLRSATATAAFSAGLVVALTNAAGRQAFGAVQGRVDDADWLHPESIGEFEALRAAAAGKGNRGIAVLRIALADGSDALAEGRVFVPAGESVGYVVVRVLELRWTDKVGQILAETYALTRGEIEVTRDFYALTSIAAVAGRRGTSELTVRTQLRSAIEKMGVGSQVKLVQRVGILCATSETAQPGEAVPWADPWGNERVTRRRDGLAAGYTSTGPADGRPLLVVHGFSHGYLLGPALEKTLAAQGVRLIAAYKHGCGPSESSPELSDAENFAASVEAVVDAEGIRGCPVLAIGSGAIPVVLLANADPAMFRAILCVADGLPMTLNKVARLSLIARSVSNVGRDFPAAIELAARSAYRNVERQGVDWYLARRFSENGFDRATRTNPETAPLLRNAIGHIFTQPPELFARQFRQRWFLNDAHYRALPVPFRIMLGAEDSMLDRDQLERYAALLPGFAYDIVERAGELLIYQQPDIVLDRIMAMMDAPALPQAP